MKTKRMVIALALGGALGCGGGSNGLPPNTPIQKSLALTAFGDDDCDGLRRYIADTAELQMKAQIELEKQNGGVLYAAGGPERAGADNGGATPQTAGPTSYTTTNTQVAGVDEADFVKNDGTRLFVLSGSRLFINQSWPADQLALKSTVNIEGWPREMFLDGNTVTVFSGVYNAYPLQASPGMAMPACGGGMMDCGYWYSNTTKVTEIDVSDLSNPHVTSEVYLPGSYNTSRKVGDEARVVLSDAMRWPQGVSYWPDNFNFSSNPDDPANRAAWIAALDALETKNTQLIQAAPLSDWLPVGKRKRADGTTVDLAYKCSDFSRSNAPSELGIVTVASLDLAHPEQDPQRSSVLGYASTVYANADALYLASPHWYWWPELGQSDYTYLYKFDLKGQKAQFVAAGGVPGLTFDPFSIDEANGYLRIATAIDTRVPDTQNPDNTWGTIQTTNKITVLQQDGNALKQVGQTTDIAKGERLMSARFVGDRAFLTTFHYVDPFFTFDLSDPTQPHAVGQLEVPGYSTYLQAIDATHVLAIGQDTGSGGDVQPQGVPLQLSLFDVSDLAHPKLVSKADVGVGYSSSEALWDHKAFNWYPEKHLLAIPFSDWIPYTYDDSYWDSFVSDLRVFSVDPATGITAKGALSLRDVYVADDNNGWSYYWEPEIRRSVMADDFVYAISDAGLRVANVGSLQTPIATVTFPAEPMALPPLK